MNIENTLIKRPEFFGKLESPIYSDGNDAINFVKLDRPIVFVLTQETRSELPQISSETREALKEKGYSENTLDAITSEEEAKIYEKANLEPTQINGKDVLVKTDIDFEQCDDFGKTNLERMQAGKAPLDKDGRPIELHHIGQKNDSPLAELTRDEHRGQGNDNILHNKIKESEINREDFNKEREAHWKARAEILTS